MGTRPRVVAAGVPVVKSSTVSDSLRERGRPMSVQVKKFHAALKHGAFSATAILPGEDPDALKELHQNIIAELAPVGALEEHIVWTIARLVWRKEHLATLRIGEPVLEHESRIQAQKSQFELLEMEKYSAERREATMHRALPIQQFPKLGTVGVLKPCCTTAIGLIRV